MRRFYAPVQKISKDRIIISDSAQIHHLKDVLRLKPGNRILVFDAGGNEFITTIKKISSSETLLNIKQKRRVLQKNNIKITVACAIPKMRKMDEIVDKLTQLGIEKIIPLKTSRVIIRWDNTKINRHLKRWQKISDNAAGQSQRPSFLVIEQIKNIIEVLEKKDEYDLKLIPTFSKKREILKNVLAKSKFKNILILIGPEGDFTKAEVALARNAGCIPVSLGNLVLRVETAAVAAVSFIKLYNTDFSTK